MRNLFLTLVLVFISFNVFADIRLFELHRQKVLAQKYEALDSNSNTISNVQKLTFEQKLNHNDPNDKRTFTQRYFLNSIYAENNNSPVLYYICGESECSPRNSILPHAESLKAHVVYVEHRYYGKSLPTYNLTTENLKYLSTDMALEDLKAIQNYLMHEKGMKGKWIVIGGSYAGSLAAYYRLKNPNLVLGALSSSGPVMARENFEEYDLHVSRVVGISCGKKMREVVTYIESLFSPDKSEELLEVKKRFRGDVLTDNVDFMYLIADMGALAVQYGYVDRFCELVDTEDPLKGYAYFTREIFLLWGMDALDMSAAGAIDPEITPVSNGMRQWFYQSCTEYGYWQNAYHDKSISVRSSLINSEYHKNICKRLFGLEISGNEEYINNKYYLPLLDSKSVTNILYTNGSEDPWLNLSIAPENKNNINDKTSTFTMQGASHCSDLGHTDLNSVQEGKKLFLKFAHTWLGL